MDDFIPSSLLVDIPNQFWKENENYWNKYVSELIESIFSNKILRALIEEDLNPIGFKNLTFYIDCRESRINYFKVI